MSSPEKKAEVQAKEIGNMTQMLLVKFSFIRKSNDFWITPCMYLGVDKFGSPKTAKMRKTVGVGMHHSKKHVSKQ